VHRQFVEIDTDGSGALDRRARAPAPPGPFLEGEVFTYESSFVRLRRAARLPGRAPCVAPGAWRF